MAKKQSKKGGAKDVKKRIQNLVTKSNQANDAGDYALVREINNEIISLGDGGDAVAAATKQNENLDLDNFLLKFLGGVALFYAGGWLFAFFH